MSYKDDYRYTSDGKIKRSVLSSHIWMDGKMNRMARYGKTLNKIKEDYNKEYKSKGYNKYNGEIKWEQLNHFEDEINDYENKFNKLVIDSSVENNQSIHINGNCYCSSCIVRNKLNNVYDFKYLSNCEIIKKDNKHFIKKIVENNNFILIPLSDCFKSFYDNDINEDYNSNEYIKVKIN